MGQRLRFAWERDAKGLRPVFQFVDAAHARQFLDALAAGQRYWLMLRRLRDDSPQLCGQGYRAADQLIEELAQHLAHRTLLVVEDDAERGLGGGGRGTTPPPSTRPPPGTIAPATFIAIELVDELGRPVPSERYRITLPDGTIRQGRLDERGLARIDGVRPAGPCDITFPEIHGDEWRPS